MADITLPFASNSARRRVPDSGELSEGIPCGPLDEKMFNWLFWHSTGQLGNFISLSGQTPSDSDLQQLATVARSQRLNYVVASGTANALTATVTPAPASLAVLEGVPFRVKMPFTNTGATTFKINALAAAPVVRANGSILFDGDLVSGGIYEMVYDGTSFRAVTLTAPPVLIRPVTLYVNAAIGSDGNDGTANTAGKALATIQGAVNRAWGYGPGPHTVTIIVAAGDYGPVATPFRSGPSLNIIGNTATPSAVRVLGGLADGVAVFGPNVVSIDGVRAETTGNSRPGFIAYGAGTLNVTSCETGACAGAALQATGGGQLWVANHRFAGSCSNLYLSNSRGFLSIEGSQTIAAPIAVLWSTAVASDISFIGVSASGSVNFENPGNVISGLRFTVTTNGVINTLGRGTAFFPGSGTAQDSGGSYV